MAATQARSTIAATVTLLVGGSASAAGVNVNPADLFRHTTETIELSAGDPVFHEGDEGDVMYVVLDGAVNILIGSTVVETAERGALLGEMALIDNAPRSASAIAKTPCRLVAIDQRRFHFLVQQTPNFSTHVMKVLAERLRKMDSLLKTGGT
jgi:CRP/FNR family cyclic AMP-dependent transcriptional regulator